MSIHRVKKNVVKYGFNAVKAARLHKKIEELDKESCFVVNDVDAYFKNRKQCWNIETKLARLAR